MAYKVGDLVDRLMINEPMVRKLLVDAGVAVDELVVDLDEKLSREDIVRFAVDRCGSREGNIIADLLADKWNNEKDL